MSTPNERPVLLLGSVPFDSAGAVFEAVGSILGPLVKRIPDGEVGPRKQWLLWQAATMQRATGIEVGGMREVKGDASKFTQYKLKAGATAADVDFGALGYLEAAVRSYQEFVRLRDAGKIPAGTRFQVSLPTPLAIVLAFIVPSQIRTIWPVFERRLAGEVAAICAAIPHRDLAIQWDIAVEIDRILEVPAMAKIWSMAELVEAIARISNPIPPEVELGLHLCYGDPGHKHVVEPKDTALMVEFANRLAAAITRPIAWIHMPVPRDRDDDAYFAPLRQLALKPGTEFYLGLVHFTDGIDGAKRRLAAARRVAPHFGIATECGLGRRPPETIPLLLALHREIALLP